MCFHDAWECLHTWSLSQIQSYLWKIICFHIKAYFRHILGIYRMNILSFPWNHCPAKKPLEEHPVQSISLEDSHSSDLHNKALCVNIRWSVYDCIGVYKPWCCQLNTWLSLHLREPWLLLWGDYPWWCLTLVIIRDIYVAIIWVERGSSEGGVSEVVILDGKVFQV